MKRTVLSALLVLSACNREPQQPTFETISVALPADTLALPPGPHADLVSANCLSCHSAEMITTQPRLTKAQWQGEVEKMVKVYKAPIDPKDWPAIVDYLVATNERLTPQ